jgi:hypothetical protein
MGLLAFAIKSKRVLWCETNFFALQHSSLILNLDHQAVFPISDYTASARFVLQLHSRTSEAARFPTDDNYIVTQERLIPIYPRLPRCVLFEQLIRNLYVLLLIVTSIAGGRNRVVVGA